MGFVNWVGGSVAMGKVNITNGKVNITNGISPIPCH